MNRLHQNCYQTFDVNLLDKIWREFFDLHIDLLSSANEKRKICLLKVKLKNIIQKEDLAL